MQSRAGFALSVLSLVASAPLLAGAVTTSHLASDAELNALLPVKSFVAEGRIGDLGGAATFELDIGSETSAPAQTAQYAWPNASDVAFTISYDGTATRLIVGSKTVAYPPGTPPGGDFYLRTRSNKAGASIRVSGLVLDGVAIGGQSYAVFGTNGGLDILRVREADLSAPFTLTGIVRMTWNPSARPTNSNLAFQAKFGVAASATPPTVGITSPGNGLLTATTPIAVSGAFTGTSPVTVSVNGVPATLTGSSYSAAVPLAEGANTLTATATNAAGSASTAVSVTLDTTPPIVTISAPADGLITGATSATVTGTVTDASPISSLTVNGTAVTLAAGAFSTTVPLVVGANPISASATDAVGNIGTAGISVTRATPPAIAIDAPASGLLTGQSPIAVSGTVTGTPPLVVNVNGVAAVVSGGSFSTTVVLAEGANPITATATNAAGSDSASVSVTLDTTPPVVTITAPSNGAVFSSTPQSVAGTVLDASPIAALSIAGQSVAPANSFSRSIGLQSGLNPIAVEATDAAGNTGFASIVVTLQSSAPPLAIAIQSPPDGALVSTPFLPVTGSLSDPNASVAVGGVAAEASAEGFVVPVVVLVEGDNLLVATARRGSETASDSVTVRYEKPPGIFILHPRNGMRLRQAATDVSGFVDEPAAAVDVNGVTATVNEAGGFVARGVPLALGDNPLVAQAVDLDGGVGSDTAKVYRDDGLPPLLRLVLYDPGRFGIGFESFVADDFAAFRSVLARGGRAPEQFSPNVDRIVVGQTGQVFLYVFAEESGTVTIPEVEEFFAEPAQELRPIDELPLELDPMTILQILPLDFEPRFFGRYLLTLPNGES